MANQTEAYEVRGTTEDEDGNMVDVMKVFTDREAALNFAGAIDDCELITWQAGEVLTVDDAASLMHQL